MIEDRIGLLLVILLGLIGVAWLGFAVWALYTVIEWLVTK